MQYPKRRIREGGLLGWLYAQAANAVEAGIWPLEAAERWLDERGFQATKRWEQRRQAS